MEPLGPEDEEQWAPVGANQLGQLEGGAKLDLPTNGRPFLRPRGHPSARLGRVMLRSPRGAVGQRRQSAVSHAPPGRIGAQTVCAACSVLCLQCALLVVQNKHTLRQMGPRAVVTTRRSMRSHLSRRPFGSALRAHWASFGLFAAARDSPRV